MAGALAENYVTQYAEDRARRARALATAAAKETGMSPEDLIQSVLEDERKRELLARAMQEAVRALDEQQVVGLARAFATGAIAEDPAAVDEAMIALEAIGQLGAPHWRLITVLLGSSRMTGLNRSIEEIASRFEKSWLREEIVQTDPGLLPAIDALIGRLAGLGLIVDTAIGTVDYRARWELTEFGKTCAAYMRLLGRNQAAT